jgi:hypothetical protein
VDFLTRELFSTFPDHGQLRKIEKTYLAKKPQPPDCGITSVSLREHVRWQFQPTKPQHLIGIKRQCLKKHILDRDPYYSYYLEVGGGGGSL